MKIIVQVSYDELDDIKKEMEDFYDKIYLSDDEVCNDFKEEFCDDCGFAERNVEIQIIDKRKE